MSLGAKIWLYLLIALVLGFGIGFFFANNANRSEVQRLQNEIAQLKDAQKSSSSSSAEKLSREEINEAFASAERGATDFNLQKRLGISLYRYAVMQNETEYLPEIEKILRRAAELQPKDFETLANVGNIIFDRSQTENTQRYAEARSFYEKALEVEPKNAEILTEIGVTYFLENPSNPEKALSFLEKSKQLSPNAEKTLANLAQIQITLGKNTEADATIAELKKINPQNPNLADLQTNLSQRRNASGNGDSR